MSSISPTYNSPHFSYGESILSPDTSLGDYYVDGVKLSNDQINHVLFTIKKAMKAAGNGKSLLLADLKDKATKEDSWVPPQNYSCDSLEIMKSCSLVDKNNCMPSHIRSVIKDWVIEDGFNVTLKPISKL